MRRATVDAMVDANRPALRPLFERALADPDAWTRWKALRGLVELGIEPSRDALSALATDTDFRVRLEAASALRVTRSVTFTRFASEVTDSRNALSGSGSRTDRGRRFVSCWWRPSCSTHR